MKQLADTFDSMLARLEAGFDRQAVFVRNASHELRTPLSVIRAEADVALADEGNDPQALRSSVAVMRDAGRRSERLIDALLTLAQADRDDQPRSEVDLAQLVLVLIEQTDLGGLGLFAIRTEAADEEVRLEIANSGRAVRGVGPRPGRPGAARDDERESEPSLRPSCGGWRCRL